MGANLAQFFKALPSAYRRDVVKRVLAKRGEGGYDEWFDDLLDEHLKINGFSKPPHALENSHLAVPLQRTVEQNAEVARAFVFAIRQLLKDADSAAQEVLAKNGFEIVEDDVLTKKIALGQTLSATELRNLVNALQARDTSVDRLDACLLCAVLAGRLPDPRDVDVIAAEARPSAQAPTPSSTAAQPNDGSKAASVPVVPWTLALASVVQAVGELTPDRDDWDELLALAEKLCIVVRSKAAERSALREAAARNAATVAALENALESLRADGADGLRLVGTAAARVVEWKAADVLPQAAEELTVQVEALSAELGAFFELRKTAADPLLDVDRLGAITEELKERRASLTRTIEELSFRFAPTSTDAVLPPVDEIDDERQDANADEVLTSEPEPTPTSLAVSSAPDSPTAPADPEPPLPVARPAPEQRADAALDAAVSSAAHIESASDPQQASATEATSAPVLTPPPPAPAPALPPQLESFAAFQEAWWSAPDGRLAPTPWRATGFADDLRAGADQALKRGDLATLWILDEALAMCGESPLIDRADLEALSAILTTATPVAGSYSHPERQKLLRDGAVEDAPRWRAKVFLEAIRPSAEAPLSIAQAEDLVSRVKFADANLRAVTLGLLRFSAQGTDPVGILRAHLLAVGANPDQAAKELSDLRAHLHREYVRLYKGAGGTVLRNHCKHAWNEFISAATPILKPLFPSDRGGRARATRWDVDELHRQLKLLRARHAEIADERNAAFQDRTHMESAADELVGAALRVNAFAAQLWDDNAGRADKNRRLPIDATRRLLSGEPLSRADEELCRTVIAGELRKDPKPVASAALHLDLARIAAHPQLLAVVPVPAGDLQATANPAVAAVQQVEDVRRAAALLLQPAEPVGDTPPSRALARHLASPRHTWLQPLAGVLLPGGLAGRPTDGLELHAALTSARELWRQLDALASRAAPAVRRAIDDASRLLESPRGVEPSLYLRWLSDVSDFARGAVTPLVTDLQRAADAKDNPAATAAIQEGRYAEARLRLSGEHVGSSEFGLREVAWRSDARKRYPRPLEAIVEAIKDDANGLLDAWTQGITKQAQGADRKLRGAFVDAVIGEGAKGWNQPRQHVIPCETLRARLASLELNPTFLPQLAHFANLVITVAPAQPRENNFAIATAGALQSQPEHLYAVLAPHVSPSLREETIHEFRKRNLNAALVDDLDLCRLLRLGGQRPYGLVGLCEVVFEQLPWASHFTPFAIQDGQNVLVETYVGRRKEALEIARTATYSRLFSGRKLGKSALIRHVHDTQNGKLLPSGNMLHVVVVPAVGAESDAVIVSKILDELKREVGFAIPAIDVGSDPAGALARVAREFVEREPKKSLLIVLDEADQFVEAQIEAYERDYEKCLSFRMRSEVQAHVDGQKLPRVRFLFAGYRTTNLSEGAWANWGQVLTLRPLSLEEGARLVAGPLARIGIDASRQASAVAYRCGCQPAVIIALGRTLLRRLDGGHSPGVREGLALDPEIASACNDEAVQEEIRTIVKNNFRDSPRARILFQALLLEFNEYPPGTAIPNAPERLTRRLEEIDPDLSWIHPEADGRALEVSRLLRDFVSRELLVRQEVDGAPVYFLRFPHHLPVLLQQDPEQVIRQEIRILRQRGPDRTGRRRGLLEDERFELLRTLVSAHDPDYPVRAVVVGSHWPDAVAHMSGGIPDRVGIAPDRVVRVEAQLARREEPLLAVHGVTPKSLDALLHVRRATLPPPLLLGGAELLRTVMGRKGDDLFETIRLGRLSRDTVEWWFLRVRGLEIHDEAWVEKVMAFTSGVPWLLRWVERALIGEAHAGGLDVPMATLAGVLQRRDLALASFASALREGPAEERLTERELQLIAMMAVLGRAYGYKLVDPVDDLISWDEMHRSALEVPAFDPTIDAVSIAVIQALGVVPLDPGSNSDDAMKRIFVPPADDALYALADVLGRGA